MGTATLIIRRSLMGTVIAINRIIASLVESNGLHRARFAHPHELASLLSVTPTGDSLLLGVSRFKHFVLVRPTHTRRELGNLLLVAPTRGGKGLQETSQLLSWGGSVVVNDIKGELFTQTAGYRATLGKVFVIDPTGVGHRYDPMLGKTTEDQLYAAAARLLYTKDERDPVFTNRATDMLTQIFLAARAEHAPPLPYTRQMIRLGLQGATEHLQRVNPSIATQFLLVQFEQASFTDRFLLSCWGTLTSKLKPLLTETVVRCFAGSDFTPDELMLSDTPITVYLRWPERDILALSPLVRLLWGSIVDELITTYDERAGKGCKKALLLVDEAARTPIPSLVDHATTVAGRGITLEIAVQSLEQLTAEYGAPSAKVLIDNMDSHIFYPPNGLETAQYISNCLGKVSAYAHSTTERGGAEVQEGLSEQGIPLMTPQEIKQMNEDEVIGFHRRLRPFRMKRLDWRHRPLFIKRRNMPPPELNVLPPIADMILAPEADEDILDPEMLE